MLFYSNHNEIYDVLHKLQKSKSSINMKEYKCVDDDNGLNLTCDQAKFLKYILKHKNVNNIISQNCVNINNIGDKCLNKQILLDNLYNLKNKIKSFRNDFEKLYNNMHNNTDSSVPSTYSGNTLLPSTTSTVATDADAIIFIIILVAYVIGGVYFLGKYINDKVKLNKYKKYFDTNFKNFEEDINKLLDDIIKKINNLDNIQIKNICVNNINIVTGEKKLFPVKCKKTDYSNIKSTTKKLIKIFLKNLNNDSE
jgi:hypothetical protein